MWALYNSYHRHYLQKCAENRRSESFQDQTGTKWTVDEGSFAVEGRQFHLHGRPTWVDDSISNISDSDTPVNCQNFSKHRSRGSVDALEVLQRYNKVAGDFQGHLPAPRSGKPKTHCQKRTKCLSSERKTPSKLKHPTCHKTASYSSTEITNHIPSTVAGANKQAANDHCENTSLQTPSDKSVTRSTDQACVSETQSEKSDLSNNADDEKESNTESDGSAGGVGGTGYLLPNSEFSIQSSSNLPRHEKNGGPRIPKFSSRATEIHNLQMHSKDCAFRSQRIKIPEASLPPYSPPASPLNSRSHQEKDITNYVPIPGSLPSFRYAIALRHPELNSENDFDTLSKSISADIGYLQKREKRLLIKRWQEEWEAVRGPKSYWWELKTKQFCLELSKSRQIEEEAFKTNRDNCRGWLLAFRTQLALEEEFMNGNFNNDADRGYQFD